MSRIGLVTKETAPLPVVDRFEGGDPGALVASLAQVPELLQAASPFLGAIYGPSALPLREKEIVILRVAAQMKCRFCTLTHTVVAHKAGLSREQLFALRSDAPADRVAERFDSQRERLLVEWADLLATDSAEPGDELMAEISQCFGDHEIVEITMVGGATMMLSRYCTVLGLPASGATQSALAEQGLE